MRTLYLNDVGQHALLTPEEELKFARAARAGDFAARQTMIERNLRLVVRLLASKQLQVEPLITHRVPLADAPAACEELIEHPERALGVVVLP